MDKTLKIEQYIELYDIYKETLTNKQREVFELYYFSDYSLGEIAELKKIARSSTSEFIRKTENNLISLEKKIGMLEQKKRILLVLNNIDDKNLKDTLEMIIK